MIRAPIQSKSKRLIFARERCFLMSYLADIQKERLLNIKEEQERFLFSPDNYGEALKNSEHFFEDIYRTYLDEKNRRAFLVSEDFHKQFKCENAGILAYKSPRFTYFTPSIFWHHRLRTKEQLFWITAITLDFDLQKDGTYRKYEPYELAQVIHNEFGYWVNYIWETKTPGNYQAMFLIKPMTGTPRSIMKFEAITKRMAIVLGADITAVDANNLYRIPKKDIWKFSDEIRDIDDFSDILDDEEIMKELEKKREENLIHFTEKQILNHEAIKMLLNAEFDQYRNHAAFTIALLYYALGKDKEEAEEFLKGEWFEKVNDGRIYSARGKFRKKEVDAIIKSAYSNRYHGPSKEWIYLLTGIEFNYNLYKSTYIKKENGYMSGNETRRKIIEWVKNNEGLHIKQSDLAKKLGVKLRSLKRQIGELKEEHVIDFKTERGRYSRGTAFEYVYEGLKEFKVEPDTDVKLKTMELNEKDKYIEANILENLV